MPPTPLARHAVPFWLLCLWSILLCVCCLSPSLRAHDPFEITTDAKLKPEALELRVTMSAGTAFQLIRGDKENGRVSPASFPAQQASLAAQGGNIFEVKAGDTPLALSSSKVSLTHENDVEFLLLYAPPQASPLRLQALLVEKLGYGFGATVLLTDGTNKFLGSKLLMGDEKVMEVPIAAAGQSAPPASAPAQPSISFRSYLRLGIEHIVTGYDHLLFLAALLVVCRTFRSVLVIVSCFTLAHSLTLAAASLDLVNVSSRIVEPLIALTIVWVGVENLLRRGQEVSGRGWLTFAFGLIHGFGFASILRETGLGRDGASVALPLLGFNLGVELGQIALAALFLPIWWQLKKLPAVEKHGAFAVSGLVAVAGLIWLLQRTVL